MAGSARRQEADAKSPRTLRLGGPRRLSGSPAKRKLGCGGRRPERRKKPGSGARSRVPWAASGNWPVRSETPAIAAGKGDTSIHESPVSATRQSTTASQRSVGYRTDNDRDERRWG